MTRKASQIIRVTVIIMAAVAMSVLGYLLVDNFQFSRGTMVLVHFASVGDLDVGAWVRKSGLKVGSVTRLQSAADETTITASLVFKPGATVRLGDTFALVTKGILGDMYIEQRPGRRDSPQAEDGTLFEGEPSFDVTDLLGGSTMSTATDLAGSLKRVIAILENNSTSLDSTLKDIAATAKNVRIVTERAVVVTESVPDITRQITTSMDTLESTVKDVSSTTKAVLTRLQSNINSSTDDLAASMKTIRKSSDDLQSAIAQLTARNSVIAKLSAPSTAESVDSTLKNLHSVSEGMLTVTKDMQKIVKGVGTILDTP